MEWQAQVGFSVRISLKSIVRNSPLEVWVRRRADHVGTWVGLIQAQRGQSALPRRCKLWGAPLPGTHFLKLARGRSDGHLACLPAHAQGGVRGVVLLTHLKPFMFKLKAAFLKKAEAWWDIRTSCPGQLWMDNHMSPDSWWKPTEGTRWTNGITWYNVIKKIIQEIDESLIKNT